MVEPDELRELIAGQPEWLLIRESGRTFPLASGEIEIDRDSRKVHFGFLDDDGYHTWRLNGYESSGAGITIDVAGAFAKKRETMRLVARTAAAELTVEIELARLQKANEIAELVKNSLPDVKLGRVALNTENGRLAQILYERGKHPMSAIADITGTLPIEPVFTAAMLWVEKLCLRKRNPVNEIALICEKRQARNAQKLHALLNEQWKARITIYMIDRKLDTPTLVELPKRKVRDLWREKPKKLALPPRPQPSEISQKILDISPAGIDIIYSKQGETLRYAGLPFARVRTVMGKEKAWFGCGRERQMLDGETWNELTQLMGQLAAVRRATAVNRRHEHYRSASEAWLESILRRNIKLLDANLILSPIYNQFRSSNDKIDLLALRRDGRLIIIELKTKPDREMVFQAADYWRKIELQRRRGVLAEADLFDGREIADKPALVYLVAPAWSFHRDFDYFARTISPEIELWRFDLHENWRRRIKVLQRRSVNHIS
ncbi:MAG: hypothetical protein ABIV21_01475 [Pyrinomonadaceae bacterium]